MRFLAYLLLLFCASAQAVSVSGCTGTPSNGNAITCTGTSMQNGVPSGMYSYLTTSTNAAYLMTDTFGTQYATGSGANYTTTKSVVNNSKAIEVGWSGASAPGSNVVAEWYPNSNRPANQTTGSKFWAGYYQSSTTGGQWLSGTFKFNSEYGSTAAGGCFLNLNANGHNGGTPPVDIGVECTNVNLGNGAGNYVWFTIPNGGWADGKWFYVEWELPCGASGNMRIWVNYSLLMNTAVSGGGACNNSGAFPSYFANGEGSNSSFDQTWWADAVAQGTSRIRPPVLIQLSDTTDCTDTNSSKVWQFPTSLADGSITFTYNKGSLTTGRYLCVADQQGNVATAYDLTGGGTTHRLPIRLSSANDAVYDQMGNHIFAAA